MLQLSRENEEWVYRFIDETLRFMPDSGKETFHLPFAIQRPFSVYDIAKMSEEQTDLLYELAPQAIQNCLKPGYKIYAVDWNHNTILYDPLHPETAEASQPDVPFFTKSGLAYYLGFYPDGDYYFFIDRFGAFGYLSHPWRQEVWIFGTPLMEEFKKIAPQLGWEPKATLK